MHLDFENESDLFPYLHCTSTEWAAFLNYLDLIGFPKEKRHHGKPDFFGPGVIVVHSAEFIAEVKNFIDIMKS